MSNVVPLSGGSPFDALRHVDEHSEYWLARELMAPLGYARWERFADAIERAIVALNANDEDPRDHIAGAAKIVQTGHGQKSIPDYRLSRYGVYATIQGADPRKPEIAAAWAYFRVRTREAEVGLGAGMLLDPDLQRIYDLTVGMQQTREELRTLARDQKELAGELATVSGNVADVAARLGAIEGHTGWWTALGYAKRRGLRTDNPYLARLGKQASSIGQRVGIEPVKTDNAVFGSVNQWPEWVWNQAASDVA
jgi:hypothetical protein